MELGTALSVLKAGSGSVAALRRFVQDELHGLLGLVGDVHFRAAQAALADAFKNAGRKLHSGGGLPGAIDRRIKLHDQYVAETIGHLRVASQTYIAMLERLREPTWASMIRETLHGGFDRPKIERSAEALGKWVLAVSTMAVCQKYLRQEALVNETIEELKTGFYEAYVPELEHSYWYIVGKPPRNTQDQRDRAVGLYTNGKPGQEEREFRQLLQNLGAKPWAHHTWSVSGDPSTIHFPQYNYYPSVQRRE